MKLKLSITSLFVACAISGFSKDYKITSATELAALKLVAGDQVIIKKGTWINQQMVLKGHGTAAKPIVLKAEEGGGTFFTGTSSLKIDGSWLVADGISFKDGATKGEDVILFSESATHCRLTNSSVVGYNPSDKTLEYTFTSLYGDHNRVDHCYFEGKTNLAPTLVVWLSDKPNYHEIDHNYFGPRPDVNGNGGETIRIGTSTWSMYDSFTTVDANIFAHCDGETEIVSVKSCRNKISNNLFFESVGTLTLRHGNYNEVYGNIFIGNQLANTGGIRVIGEHHKVYNNYLQGLSGTGLRAAISVMDGLPNPILVSHWQVKNADIIANTIVDCKEPFSLGAGKNSERILPPQKVVIANNLVKATQNPVSWVDKNTEVSFIGNMLDINASPENLDNGFSVVNAKLENQDGLWRIQKDSPVIGAFKGQYAFINQKNVGATIQNEQLILLEQKNVGPNWFKPNLRFSVK
jgi:poly(beta-D-mannuronate) lyase